MIDGVSKYQRILEMNCRNRESCFRCPAFDYYETKCAKDLIEEALNVFKENERVRNEAETGDAAENV